MPPLAKQVFLLTVDDHSGLNIAGRFVSSDTTWNHFSHFRNAFEAPGIPQANINILQYDDMFFQKMCIGDKIFEPLERFGSNAGRKP